MADVAMPEERWLPAVGHEVHYEVSDRGRVRSVPRTLVYRDGRVRFWPGKVLKPSFTRGRLYSRVALNSELWTVHQFVAATFLGPTPPGLEILHRDGDPTNNAVSNLHFGTHSENMHDVVRHGRHWQVNKVDCARGHALIGPNLQQARSALPHQRRCRACNRMSAVSSIAARAGMTIDKQAEADYQYAKLMTDPVQLVLPLAA